MQTDFVKDWMTASPVTVEFDVPLQVAFETLRHYDIRHLPVMDSGKLVGMASLSAVRQGLLQCQLDGNSDCPISQVMKQDSPTVRPDDSLRDAAVLMLKHKHSGLPVVEDGRLVGILTEADMVQHTLLSATKLPQERLIMLRDGRELVIRPIHPDDAPRLRALYGGLSAESRYLRFLRYIDNLSNQELRDFAVVDYNKQMAFVAADRDTDRVVAIAQYLPSPYTPEDEVEYSVTIADDYQRQGLGTMLMRHLMRFAYDHGVRVFYALVDAENSGMLKLIHKLGYRYDRIVEAGDIEVRIFLNEKRETN